jgi:hypothetical protein
MVYKSKSGKKKESPQLAFLRKQREEEHSRIVKSDNVGFRKLEKGKKGNR